MHRTTRFISLVGLIVAIGLIGNSTHSQAATSCPASAFRRTPPLIIAHASSSYFGPPNTIELMRRSLAAGANAIDVDARVTADGVLVAAHDDALSLVTNSDGSISSKKYADIRKLDAAWTWKDSKGHYSLRGAGVHVPSVEEVLKAFPNVPLSVEFKTTGGEAQLCTLLRQYRRTRDVWVSSAGDAAMDRFRPICPEAITTVTDALVGEMRKARASNSDWCAPVSIGQPPFRSTGRGQLSEASVKWNHDHGLALFTWTVDSQKSLELVKRLGVDGVYTGRPDIAKKVFNAR